MLIIAFLSVVICTQPWPKAEQSFSSIPPLVCVHGIACDECISLFIPTDLRAWTSTRLLPWTLIMNNQTVEGGIRKVLGVDLYKATPHLLLLFNSVVLLLPGHEALGNPF
jgi:hypothetical protein